MVTVIGNGLCVFQIEATYHCRSTIWCQPNLRFQNMSPLPSMAIRGPSFRKRYRWPDNATQDDHRSLTRSARTMTCSFKMSADERDRRFLPRRSQRPRLAEALKNSASSHLSKKATQRLSDLDSSCLDACVDEFNYWCYNVMEFQETSMITMIT